MWKKAVDSGWRKKRRDVAKRKKADLFDEEDRRSGWRKGSSLQQVGFDSKIL